MSPPRPYGLCHVALNVTDLRRVEDFYVGVVGFVVEWRPDPDNVYLRLGRDNLALHRASLPPSEAAAQAFNSNQGQRLAHLGIVLLRPEHVDAWAAHLHAAGIALSVAPRTHRDGARSFYCADPEGNAIQFLYHPPLAEGVPDGTVHDH